MKPYYSNDGIEIYLGDCREVLPEITGDVVLTDPPYNVGLNYSDGDNRPDYAAWCAEWFNTSAHRRPWADLTYGNRF